jgi:hypothetical protein
MSTEGSTTSESGSTEDLYPVDQPVVQPVVHINNNLDDVEPQPNNMVLQNIVSKLNNKGGKRRTMKSSIKKARKTRKTRTSKRKSRKMRKSKKQK